MSIDSRPVAPSLAKLARAGLVVAMAGAWSAGVWLLWLDRQSGPAAQRVSIRWAPDTAADPHKLASEQDALGLTAGEENGPRTWSYRLAVRSSENIGRILSNPAVE